jgi:large subunit ribosomal protein L29
VKANEFKKQIVGAQMGELAAKLREERAKLYKLNEKLALKQQENPLAIRETKRNIARILTAMRQQEMKVGKE